jgi:hypothetical protein
VRHKKVHQVLHHDDEEFNDESKDMLKVSTRKSSVQLLVLWSLDLPPMQFVCTVYDSRFELRNRE